MGTLNGMSAVIAGGPAAGALMPPLGCVLCHAGNRYSLQQPKVYKGGLPEFRGVCRQVWRLLSTCPTILSEKHHL